jgi:pyruvate/2-oxoglutarate dehydrogenase complex dihydrolipoamide acyltransferase (E2) component
MSRARDLARKAMARNMKEQANVTPNPFTVPEINISKMPKKSRQMNIVREAMADAKKKKKEEKVTEAGTDKFITDPELASQITKS